MPKNNNLSLPQEIWVLISASFIIALGYGLVAPILPLFAKEFDVSTSAASLIVSSFALMRLLFAPLTGHSVQKFGEKKVYLAGIIIVAISTGACAFTNSYLQLLTLRSLGGIGSIMFTVSAMGLIIRLSPEGKKGKVLSLYAGSFLLGSIFGPILGAVLSPLGFQILFKIYALALTISCLSVAILLRKSHLTSNEDLGSRPKLLFKETIKLFPYRAALGSNFINGWVSFGVRVSIIPLFIGAVLDSGAKKVGIVMAVYALGNASVVIHAGKWSDQYGRKKLIILGFVLAGLCTMFLGLKEQLWWYLILSAISGIGAGLSTPSLQATVADIIGSKSRGGHVLASFQMASDLGAICGPLIIGFLADTYSYKIAFLLSGLLLLLAAFIWIFSEETKAKHAL